MKAQSIEPVMSEGKPGAICQVVKVEKVKQYKMVDKTGGIACWVEAADVVEKKGLGWNRPARWIQTVKAVLSPYWRNEAKWTLTLNL